MVRSRAKLASSVASFALMALLTLALVTMGCGGGDSDPGPDVQADPDIGVDVGVDDVVGPLDVSDPDVPEVKPDVPDVQDDDIEVCDPTECATELADQLGPCDEAVCNDDNECEVQRTTDAPDCCVENTECATAMAEEMGACDEALCNADNECELQRNEQAPDCCVDNAECATAMADDIGPCDEALCNAVNECEIQRATDAPNCCTEDAECDDGDPLTIGTCPTPGDMCVQTPQACGSDSWCWDNRDDLSLTAGICQQVRCCLAPDCEDSTGGDINQGLCYVGAVGDCCTSDADCDDSNACTDDSCVDNGIAEIEGGSCLHVPNDQCVCDEQVVFEAQFDEGTLMAAGFDVFDLNPDDDITWNIDRDGLYAGKGIYLGDPQCRMYFNGDHTVDGNGQCVFSYPPERDPHVDHNATSVWIDLVSQEMALPDGGVDGSLLMLEFFVMGEGEMPLGIPGLADADALVVRIEDTQDPNAYGNCGDSGHPDYLSCQIFSTADYDNSIPMGMLIASELSSYAGKTVKLHFTFDTFDTSNNRYEGWYLDAIRLRSYCANRRCDGGGGCAVLNACMDDTCTEFANQPGQGICAEIIDPPGCMPCSGPADCDDMDECTVEMCDEGQCAWEPDPSPECCSPIMVLDADFEADMPADWSVDDDGTDVLWQVVTDDESGESYLYFGDADTMTFENGGIASGSVATEPFDLPDPTQAQVINLIAYWTLNLSTEFDDIEWFDGVVIDRLYLYANYLENGELTKDEIWSSVAVEGSTHGEWLMQGVDIMAYAGKTVWFSWEFDSGEAYSNLYAGAMIDSFKIKSVCGDYCFTDNMCESMVASDCWTSTCDDAVCSAPILLFEGCCDTVADCLPGNACTTVSCTANACSYQDDADSNTCCEGAASANGFELAELPDTYEVVQVDNGDPLNAVTWQLSERCGHDSGSGLYFGDEDFGDYYTSQPTGVGGSVLTPDMLIPSSGNDAATWLQFDLYLDTEWNNAQREGWSAPTGLERDKLTLSAVEGTTTIEIWNSFGIDYRGSSCHDGLCGWQTVQVNLSAYHGYNLKFLFEFDSLDDIANDGLGVCVDNLTVMTGCTGSDYECFQSEECPLEGPPDECYWYYCVNNQCDDEYIGGLNCCDVAVFAEESWEAGGSGWQYVPDNGTVRWQVADIAEAHEGSHFLYFGNTAAMNYNDGGATSGGEALSPQFVLPTVDADTDAITLRFAYYLDVEAYDVGAPGRDAFTVTAINPQSGQQTELMNKSNIPASHIGSDPLAWHVWEADMTDFSGEVIQVQFLFDSGDGNNNDGLGLLIDSFEIETEICE